MLLGIASNKLESICKNNRILSIIIFSLFFSWLLAFPFEGQILYLLAEENGFDVHNILFGSIGFHFLGLLLCGFFIKNIKRVKQLMSFSIIVCIIGSIVFYFESSIVWTIALFIMSFLSGACVAAWGFYFKYYTSSNERMKTAADALIFSNLLMIIINMAAIYLSVYIGLTISILELVFALFFSTKVNTKSKETEILDLINKEKNISLTKTLAFLYIFITVITINSGLMYQVINPEFEHYKLLTSWYFALPYIIALFIMKKLPRKINRTYILFVAIAMIGISFILFMILDNSVISYLIVNTLMLGACGVYDLFWWSILGEMLDFSDNPAKILGIGLSANVMGVFIGGILGNRIISIKIQNEKISVIALIIVFITIIILLPLHNQLTILLKNHIFLTALTEMVPAEQISTIESYTIIAQLTKRESEIVALLLKGRTYKMIANELYLSENTIKTHIKNIYSKLNIKSKVELINYINNKAQ